MKIDRTKNTIRSSTFGIINKVITLIIPFFIRTLFVKKLGMEYLGLNTLFASVLNVLNIAELGIGSSIVYCMYSAISDDNSELICSLLNYFKKVYRVIGCIVLIIGLAITPIIPYLIKGTVPSDVNIFILYFINLGNTLFGYFLFAYKSSLLTSFQRNDIISNIATICSLFAYSLQIIVLFLNKNYYCYISITILSSLLYNIIIAITVNHSYPDYKATGNLDPLIKNEIFKKIKALFLYRVGGIVLISVDSIVISYFFGLSELAKYNNYYYVIQTLFGFLAVFYSSLTSGIGNSIAMETTEKNYKDFNRLVFLQKWAIGWCTVCLICLYQPFMYLWLGESKMYPFGLVICFSIYFYTWKMMEIVNVYKDASGLWDYDKFRPIVASVVNLVLNIILCRHIGIYGILISTIVAIVFVIFPWSTHTLFKHYFKQGFRKYVFTISEGALTTSIICFVTLLITNRFDNNDILSFLIKIVICIIVPNCLYLLIYFRTTIFKETIAWITNQLNKIQIKDFLKIK